MYQAEESITENPLWQKFITHYTRNRLNQALLLCAPASQITQQLLQHMTTAMLCSNQNPPCENCQSCHLSALGEHPDRHILVPDKPGGMIKIEQIRQLQDIIFKTPQLSANRVLTINPADKMNVASSNALLKMLEEPPEGVYFILISEHPGTMSATIRSRCQIWYAKDREQQGTAQSAIISNDLLLLQQGAISVCALAEKWSKLPFPELIADLYELITKFITEALTKRALTDPVILFQQLDKLNRIKIDLNHNISMNAILTLEEFLEGFQTESKLN